MREARGTDVRETCWARGGAVSVRRQLVARLEASILEGDPPPGHRLPGIRALARRLGVHRHTAAAVYRELADAGHVVTVPGSGTYVADPLAFEASAGRGPRRLGASGPGHDPARAFRAFLVRERAAGTGSDELASLFSGWCAQAASRRVLLVEPAKGLRRILLQELRRALPCRVEPLSVLGLRRSPGRPLGGIPVARAPVLGDLLPRLAPGTEALPLRLSGGARELAIVRSLPPRSVVAVVTESRAVRRKARELLAAELRRGTGLLLPGPGDARAVARALRIARVLFADALCVRRSPLRGCRRRVEVRLLAPGAAAALRAWLGEPEGVRGNGRMREGSGSPRHGAG